MKTHRLVPFLAAAAMAAAQAQENPAPATTTTPQVPNPETLMAVPSTPAPLFSTAPVGPESALIAPAAPGSATAPAAPAGPGGAPAGMPPSGSPFRSGNIVFSPHPSYSIMHTDGILAEPGLSVATTVQDFAPGFLLQFGPIWSLDYTPSWQWYTNSLFHNTFDQNARLAGVAGWQDWKAEFSQTASETSQPLIETGRQTTEEDYVTDGKLTHSLSTRTYVELEGVQSVRTAGDLPDYYQWSTLDWLHFVPEPGVDTAAGVGLGYVDAVPGYNMDFIQPQARVSWRPNPFFQGIAQGGWEYRQILGGTSISRPIYRGSLDWMPTPTTRLTALAQQDLELGYSLNQLDEAARESLGFQQRLLGHFFLGANVGEETIQYLDVGRTITQIRADRAEDWAVNLSTVFFRRLTIAVQYSDLLNHSDLPGFGFLSHQWGLTASFRY